ncbi:hypothetical protein CIPAW_11G111300 [Carya illinoinensis]|uniref:Uncharacterized protein n=1 Tax=Carya illinoinensis TaxID=32201 RepID=A0A8T1P161_CARIL|nr:hypothetical protein CIPAW_11G111300 [Carya illinoinensis]
MTVLVSLALLMLVWLWMMLRIIKWIIVQFPAGASGGGNGFSRMRNGFVSGIFRATDHHHHHHLFHVLVLISICCVLFSPAFCFLLCLLPFPFPFSNGGFHC